MRNVKRIMAACFCCGMASRSLQVIWRVHGWPRDVPAHVNKSISYMDGAFLL
jgi:hypothetical protein